MDDYYVGWDSLEKMSGVVYKNNIAYARFYRHIDDYPLFEGRKKVVWFTAPILLGRVFDTLEELVEAIESVK
jgi:hypothetical protein